MQTALEINSAVGKRIRHERKVRGLSLQEMAGRVGVSYQQLQKYESGANALSVWRLVHICELFAVPPEQFLRLSEIASTPLDEDLAVVALMFPRLAKKEKKAVIAVAQTLVMEA